MQGDIQEVLIDRHAIERRVTEIAARITADLGQAPDERGAEQPAPLTLVPILTGSIIFVSDLIRKLPLRMQIHLVSVSSYPGASTTTKGAKLSKELTSLPDDLGGSHVLIIDDILDSGHTLRLVTDLLVRKHPQSIRTCVLLRKQRPRALAFQVDYVGFDIPDQFVVGYGLDYNDHYRNLPDIVTLRPEVLRGGT